MLTRGNPTEGLAAAGPPAVQALELSSLSPPVPLVTRASLSHHLYTGHFRDFLQTHSLPLNVIILYPVIQLTFPSGRLKSIVISTNAKANSSYVSQLRFAFKSPHLSTWEPHPSHAKATVVGYSWMLRAPSARDSGYPLFIRLQISIQI